MEKVRVSKLMSEQGICSRREADSYIERGWVLVDGVPVTELGTRAFPNQKITLARSAQSRQEATVTVLLNKPIGYVSAQPEKGYHPAIELVTPEARYKEDRSPLRFSPVHLRGLAVAGRLDIDSTGLLVFTQDGRVAKQLIGEDSGMEKEYLVRVEGNLADSGLKLLNFGLSLDGKALKRAEVVWQNRDQLCFAARGQEAPDPAHVRAGRPQGHRLEARPRRQRAAGRAADGAVAISQKRRALLKNKDESRRMKERTLRQCYSAFRLPPYFCTSFCTRQLRVSAT